MDQLHIHFFHFVFYPPWSNKLLNMTKNPLSVIELKITAVDIKICTVNWAQKDLIELNEAVGKTQDDCDFSTGICGFPIYGLYSILG